MKHTETTETSRAEVAKCLRKAAANRARALPGVLAEDNPKSFGFGVLTAMCCQGKTVSEALEQLADLIECPEYHTEWVDTMDSVLAAHPMGGYSQRYRYAEIPDR